MKNLVYHDIIKVLPKTISRGKYLEIEEKIRKFAESVNVPLSHLDLVFWFKETREVFK